MKTTSWQIGVCAIFFSIVGAVLGGMFHPESAAIWAAIGTATGAGFGTAFWAALSSKRCKPDSTEASQ